MQWPSSGPTPSSTLRSGMRVSRRLETTRCACSRAPRTATLYRPTATTSMTPIAKLCDTLSASGVRPSDRKLRQQPLLVHKIQRRLSQARQIQPAHVCPCSTYVPGAARILATWTRTRPARVSSRTTSTSVLTTASTTSPALHFSTSRAPVSASCCQVSSQTRSATTLTVPAQLRALGS